MHGVLTRWQGHVLGSAVDHLRGRPVPQVDPGDRRRHRVGVDGPDRQVEAREGHGVRADAAAEVVDQAHLGAQEPRRVPRRHREPGRLLEAVGVNSIPSANVPNFSFARARSRAGCSAAATSSGSYPRPAQPLLERISSRSS